MTPERIAEIKRENQDAIDAGHRAFTVSPTLTREVTDLIAEVERLTLECDNANARAEEFKLERDRARALKP